MTKIQKIVVSVSLLSLILVCCILPCFADVSGNGATGYLKPYFGGAPVSAEFGGVHFAMNSFGVASSSEQSINKVGSSYSAQSHAYENGLKYSFQSTYVDYITEITFEFDTLSVPVHESPINRMITPNYSFELGAGWRTLGASIILNDCYYYDAGTGDVVQIGTIADHNNPAYEDLTRFAVNGNTFNAILREHGVSAGDLVVFRPSVSIDVEPDGADKFTCISISDYSSFAGNSFLQARVETVDVSNWIPSMLDGVLETELFDGFSVGTLLLLVIAVPALFAVLKMLGGAG